MRRFESCRGHSLQSLGIRGISLISNGFRAVVPSALTPIAVAEYGSWIDPTLAPDPVSILMTDGDGGALRFSASSLDLRTSTKAPFGSATMSPKCPSTFSRLLP